jgi:hypothetical protein
VYSFKEKSDFVIKIWNSLEKGDRLFFEQLREKDQERYD